VHDHFGCWRWQPYSEPKYAQRNAWYNERVVAREVAPPLQAAARWMRHVVPPPPRSWLLHRLLPQLWLASSPC